ncbi:GNAT family N-acetyltransferase [Oscillochloris sp. ZM17-4]|uniref:GNAT family N-acetyltransferase n=1 Tax=Oscillochloris sp. ZM17-4 TaxID=2866714 RepID=UPI001C7329FB|nr:GNAT family N-acetyltransferase [Oscillochloris sp. ZM17-4]MBX0329591.1 GNAT family N-acetyltransferase [Oscillochloris sp. ZM17-4]
MSLRLELIDHTTPTWPAELAALWRGLGAPHNPELLPDYFVQTTFVKMGGLALRILHDDALIGAGLLFPRGLEGGRRVYTLRVSWGSRGLEVGAQIADSELRSAADHLLNRQSTGLGVLGPPPSPQLPTPNPRVLIPESRTYAATHRQIGGFDIGAPGEDELGAIRALHAAIWGAAPGAQYPGDLHSAEFGPATSLVARADGRLAGFLLGFHRFGGLGGLERAGVDTALSVESQVMGVDPGLRRAGLAATLKRAQAAEALARGVGVIHWTADPLQFANATLNFHKLRAVAGEFYPAYYPFQNELNRVPASRLGIAWLPATDWGRAGLADGPRRDRALSRLAGCAVLNDGPRALRGPGGAPHIAVEIPADWTVLQRDDLDAAAAWREATDAILAERLGFAQGRYLIADVATEGERRYLVGHAVELMAPFLRRP